MKKHVLSTLSAYVDRQSGWVAHDDAEAGAAGLGVSPRIIGHVAAIIFGVCGSLALLGLALPIGPGANRAVLAISGSTAVLCGVLTWLLPWNSWPRWYTHILVPVGFALIGFGISFSGTYAYLFGAMFCVCFAAVGLAHRPGTSVLMLPLFAPAYALPLLASGLRLALTLSFTAMIGVLCVVVAETVAWITVRLSRSQTALLRAHAAVNDISADLTSMDATGLAQSAATRLSRLLQTPDVAVYSLSEDGRLTCLASLVGGRLQERPAVLRQDLSSWPTGATSAGNREPAVGGANDTSHAIPLVARGRVVGLVEATDKGKGRLIAPERVANALTVCRLIALSIQDAEALAAKEAQTGRLASMLESSQAVASVDDLERSLAILTERAAGALRVSECVAYEYMCDIDAIVPRAMWEKQPTGWDRLGHVLPLSDYPVERKVLSHGMSVLENLFDADLDPVSYKNMVAWGEKSCLTVPMRSAGEPMGLLVFWDSQSERRFDAEDMALVMGLADLAGEAVRRARLVRTLQRLSGTDALTGLANHRQIHEMLNREQARAERRDETFNVVMLDVDGFKLLNDTYGHPCGDTALRHIASILEANARASDVVGRYGGDEFVLILPETDADEAHLVVEKMRAAIVEKPFVTPTGERIPLHASFGVATYPQDGETVSELVLAADSNLYISKRQGGNAITRSGHLDPDDSVARMGFGILESMVTAVDNKDRYTRRHSEQVTELALALAAALGLPESCLRVVRAGGLLHDIGKIGIPDRILRKPGSLNPEEWAIVRGHPSMGEALIRTVPDLADIRDLVVGHHERFDGTGYPKGLMGMEIPLLARILAVADAFSAMISDRPYRKALSTEEAIAELREGAGSHFDPGVVSTFIQCVRGRSPLQPVEDGPITPS